MDKAYLLLYNNKQLIELQYKETTPAAAYLHLVHFPPSPQTILIGALHP